MPDFYDATYAYGEVASTGRELDGCDRVSEGEVVQRDPSREVCEDGAAIFVYGEDEIALWVEGKAADVLAMRERKSVRFVAVVPVNMALG